MISILLILAPRWFLVNALFYIRRTKSEFLFALLYYNNSSYAICVYLNVNTIQNIIFAHMMIKKIATKIRILNCTPFVRQYDILNNKWGDFLCQEESQINDIHRNLSNWL